MFIAVVAAAAAAFALAFGLGGREVAAEITRTWYQRGQAAGEKVSQRMAQGRADSPTEPARDEPARPAPAPVEQAPEG